MTGYLRYFFILMFFAAVPQLPAQRKEDIGKREPVDAPQRNETSDARSATDFSRANRGNTTRFFRNASKTKEIKRRLTVSEEDYSIYQSFLKNPDTGIFKLLAQPDCREEKEKEVVEQCRKTQLNIRAFANAYSFRERKHTVSVKGDFDLFANRLDGGRSEIHTIIVNLGNISLEDITLESKGVEYLKNYEPSTQIGQVRKQFETMRRGVVAGHYGYSKDSPVRLNDAYAVRSVAYANESISAKNAIDSIYVLKVVRLDEDGSVTILWKELSRKPAPKLVNEKQ